MLCSWQMQKETSSVTSVCRILYLQDLAAHTVCASATRDSYASQEDFHTIALDYIS